MELGDQCTGFLPRYTCPFRYIFPNTSSCAASYQGLQLDHYSAQLAQFLAQKYTLNTPNHPSSPPNTPPNHPLIHPLITPETTPNCTPCHTEGAYIELKSGRV